MEELWIRFVWFVLHRTTRYVVSWLLALGTASVVLWGAWDIFDKYHRDDPAFPVDPTVRGLLFKVGIIDDMDLRDGNDGHCTIDFGGQWLMGAMLVQGHGAELYDRRLQSKVLEAAYPRADEWDQARYPDMQVKHDAEEFMGWFMGSSREEEARNTYASMIAPLAAQNPFEAAVFVSKAQPHWNAQACKRAAKPYVGGPLYPPVNAFFYAPLGCLDPHDGYRVNQFLCLVYAFIGGLGVSYMTRGRWWCPLAAALILIYPGFKGAILLGQNPPLTLMILIWGWALIRRDRPVLGGIVWGFLAFKPVWGLAFFLVPFLTGRWRVCLAMGLTGLSLAAATLPFLIDYKGNVAASAPSSSFYEIIGLVVFILGLIVLLLPFRFRQLRWDLAGLIALSLILLGWTGYFHAGLTAWFEWLEVGQEAAALYNVDPNWVHLSRDLLGIPRRALIDFSLPSKQRDRLDAFYWGCGLLAFFVGSTVVLALLRFPQAHKAVTGPIVGFFMLGAWMSCFHFMYYDILLTALPMFVLLAEPRKLFEPLFLAILRVPREHLDDELVSYYGPHLPREHPPLVPLLKAGYRNLWVLNRMVPNVLLLLLFVEHLQHKVQLNVYVSGAVFGTSLETTRKLTIPTTTDDIPRTIPYTHTEGIRVLTTTLFHGGQPWDTYVCMFLWLWCGILWLRTPTKPRAAPWPGTLDADVLLLPSGDQPTEPVELETDVGGGHEGLADKYRPDPRSL